MKKYQMWTHKSRMGGSPFGTPYPAKHDVVSWQIMSNEVDLMKFGFVGLGQMGAPMAINLAQKHDVLVYDQNKTSFTNVMRSGAKGADNLGQFGKLITRTKLLHEYSLP